MTSHTGFSRQLCQFGYGPDPGLVHQAGAVAFHRSLVDFESDGDLLVELTAQYVTQHLSLAGCPCFEALRNRCSYPVTIRSRLDDRWPW